MKYWNDRLFDDGKDYCTWVFRPGYDGIHFAKARCDGDFKELSIRIRDRNRVVLIGTMAVDVRCVSAQLKWIIGFSKIRIRGRSSIR